MEFLTPLTPFYRTIAEDPRIGISHVSLYIALCQSRNVQGDRNPFRINRNTIMQMAKICARHTYNKCMNQLQEYGYIEYIPASSGHDQSCICIKSLMNDNVEQEHK